MNVIVKTASDSVLWTVEKETIPRVGDELILPGDQMTEEDREIFSDILRVTDVVWVFDEEDVVLYVAPNEDEEDEEEEEDEEDEESEEEED